MLWLKAFHVVAIVTWFAGLFYLPRLFVYHADATDPTGVARFEVMERRLFKLMTIGAVLSVGFGLAMVIAFPAYLQFTWLRIKLALVLALIAYHAHSGILVHDFARGRNRRPARWYRLYNEVPSLLLIAIVVLAIVKPWT